MVALQIDLDGRTAFVTGASRGIGRAIALTLAEAGADIVAVARSVDSLDALASEIRALGRRCLPLPADLTRPDVWEPVVDRAWTDFGPIDVLVNCAGRIIRQDPPHVTVDDFDAVFDLNVRATFFITQALGQRMVTTGSGSVITIASLAAEVVTRAPITYQASKAALVQMTRVLAVRWGPSVRVNAVGPGYVETELTQDWLSDPNNQKWLADHTALQRGGIPSEISGIVAFLASSHASYITGQHIIVDGGWCNP